MRFVDSFVYHNVTSAYYDFGFALLIIAAIVLIFWAVLGAVSGQGGPNTGNKAASPGVAKLRPVIGFAGLALLILGLLCIGMFEYAKTGSFDSLEEHRRIMRDIDNM